MRSTLIAWLRAVGLLRPAWRVLEWRKSLGGELRPVGRDGLPLPPPARRVAVAGGADPDWFQSSGRAAADAIRAALAADGARLADVGPILDLGCGCGRVLRHWVALDVPITGCDIDRRAIAWCERNLPFAKFLRHGLAPPLPVPDRCFGLVCALSMLTHLAEPQVAAWLDEIARVLRPGGRAYLTTLGAREAEALSGAERERFLRGECVVRYAEAEGTNLCTTYHPEACLRPLLERRFEVRAFLPEGAAGNPRQDAWLVRVKADEA